MNRRLSPAPAAGGNKLTLSRAIASGCMALATFGALGCTGTRLPTLRPASPQAERRQFEEFYPYGEETAGPALHAQPRGYDLPRSEATRLQRTRRLLP